MTWVAHFGIAGLVTFVAAQFGLAPWTAATYAVWGYAFREGDQLAKKLYRKDTPNFLDMALDVATAVAGASLVAWLLT